MKGGCLDGLDWGKAIHIWTKSAMLPIPEGSESHSEEPSESSYGTSQEELDQPPDAPGMLVGNGGCQEHDTPSKAHFEETNIRHIQGACDFSG